LEVIEKKIEELEGNKQKLLDDLVKLKESSEIGEITASEHLKKYDEVNIKIKIIQNEIKKLQDQIKRTGNLSIKRKYFNKLIEHAKKNYITDEELQDYIYQAYDIELKSVTKNLDDDDLDLLPIHELEFSITYLNQYIDQVITPEEIKSRKKTLKHQAEEEKRKEKELSEEQKQKNKEEKEAEKKKLKELEKEQKKISKKEKKSKKTKKKLKTEDKIDMLDRTVHRKDEVIDPLDSKGVVDRWALMHANSPVTKRPYMNFSEVEMIVKDHPNFLHKIIHDMIEDFGYKIEKERKPLPEEIIVPDKINKVFNFVGSMKGTINAEKEKVKGFTSIYVVEEGFCTFAYGEEKPSVFSKMKVSLAGDIEKMDINELKNDIESITKQLNGLIENNHVKNNNH